MACRRSVHVCVGHDAWRENLTTRQDEYFKEAPVGWTSRIIINICLSVSLSLCLYLSLFLSLPPSLSLLSLSHFYSPVFLLSAFVYDDSLFEILKIQSQRKNKNISSLSDNQFNHFISCIIISYSESKYRCYLIAT